MSHPPVETENSGSTHDFSSISRTDVAAGVDASDTNRIKSSASGCVSNGFASSVRNLQRNYMVGVKGLNFAEFRQLVA